MDHPLTDEQLAVRDAVAGGDSCMVSAFAGCAKTTTLTIAAPKSGGIAIAFNVKIRDELKKKLPETFQCLTMNGLGHRAIANALRKPLRLNDSKIFSAIKDLGYKGDDFSNLKDLIHAGQRIGIVPKGRPGKGLALDDEETWQSLADDLDVGHHLISHARQIHYDSIGKALQGEVDFSDQILVSSLIFGAFPKSACVFVDEAQDLSPQNHIMLRKTAAAQIVAVGDPHQAIYAWRGADHESMANLRSLRPTWTDLTLGLTFRCPHAVVARQNLPGFRAAPGNNPGVIEYPNPWFPAPRSAIICRNNKPLLRLGFALLRAGRQVNLLGGDLGRQLKRLLTKVNPNGKLSRNQTINKLEAMMQSAPEKVDRIESLITILENHETIDNALAWLQSTAHDAVTLSTGHRAKGLEWDHVYFLDPFLIPSKYAITEAQLRQEENLRYVIETRTRNILSLVDSKEFTDDKGADNPSLHGEQALPLADVDRVGTA